ncbi:bifunctional precorrin-2 dehydrogenase/sirohydrochlorin ferrochelatase [Lachnospiraceae bacterium]|nr:bifunctional precorrin-2 dehydrogenase/sirohydrochlorin ferrochelatase [Lachnospiraceae bacterium]
MTRYFPLFINMKDKQILVFGGGRIASRRVKALLEFGARVHVVAPQITEELKELAVQQQGLRLSCRKYRPSELEEEDFVLAATDDEEVNTTIFRECRHKGIPVNVASDQEKCDFYFPGIVKQGEITVGVTTGGSNHRKAAEVTESIRRQLAKGEGA